MPTLTPAYGRDYKSIKEVKQAFDDNKDFIFNDLFHRFNGMNCNKEDLKKDGYKTVNIRYAKNTKVAVVKL